jgi:hypothetical protein
MAVTATIVGATRLPGPPELLAGRPDAVVDLQTDAGAALVDARWRYADAEVREIDFVEVGSDADPLGPGTIPNRTYDVLRHAQAPDFDDSGWRELAPGETMLRLVNGRVSFNWYRLAVTIPKRLGDLDPTGSTVVFEVVVDDYAEVWVDGKLPLVLGLTGGQSWADSTPPTGSCSLVMHGPVSASRSRSSASTGRSPPPRRTTSDANRDARLLSARARSVRRGRRSPGRTGFGGPGGDRHRRQRAGASGGRVRVHRGAGVVARGRAALQLAEHNSIYRLDPEVGKVTLGPSWA